MAEPTVLLLDEPLSNLDAKLRTEMRFELKNLVQSLGVTTLYVTHDQMEALTMSDSVAVMHEGVFVEEAPPKELYLLISRDDDCQKELANARSQR